jgi:hypothetical protein
MRIRNAAQLVCVCRNGEKFKAGVSQKDVFIIENGTVIVNSQGFIEDFGSEV